MAFSAHWKHPIVGCHVPFVLPGFVVVPPPFNLQGLPPPPLQHAGGFDLNVVNVYRATKKTQRVMLLLR
jgi:hypothetical protein